eukprot:gene12176-biopygen9703
MRSKALQTWCYMFRNIVVLICGTREHSLCVAAFITPQSAALDCKEAPRGSCPPTKRAHPPSVPTYAACPLTKRAHPPSVSTYQACPLTKRAHPPSVPTYQACPPIGLRARVLESVL